MNDEGCEAGLLRTLAAMPLLDRLEMVCIGGWSRGAVYPVMENLNREGLVCSVPHASVHIQPTRRYCLTAAGVHRLARDEGMTVDELLRAYPVSNQWRRVLLERLDALAVVYRLTSNLANVAHPVRFRWYRAMPMDAAVGLPDGRVVAVVRQGPTADRSGFSKRLWRLRQGPTLSAVLVLASDEVRLRHARRLLAGGPFPAFLALEGDAATAGPDAGVWRTPLGPARLGLRTALMHTSPRGAWPRERLPARVSLPETLVLDGSGTSTPGSILPALLKPAEKRALDLIADWPWLAPVHLGALLGVKRSMLSRLLMQLAELGLIADAVVEGSRRLVLADRGLALLARRDRAAVGAARKRWSVASQVNGTSVDWRTVLGGRSRQLLRNLQHTEAVHWFVAVLARQIRSQSMGIVQLDAPRRASRYFRHDGQMRSVHPDAFGVLRRGATVWPFFLEWERRAVRPTTMAERLAPYLRYYASHRPRDDHGVPPVVLVVFEDEVAQAHFLRVAREEMARTGVTVPLSVSHRGLLERVGPLGQAWRTTGSDEPGYAFQVLRPAQDCDALHAFFALSHVLETVQATASTVAITGV